MKAYKIFSFWHYLIVLLLLIICIVLCYFELQHLYHKGFKFLVNKDIAQAQSYFKEAVERKPFNPRAYLNLALTYDLSKQEDKAIIYYNIVSSQTNKAPAFYAYFNKAELYGRLGNLDKALENYQEALEFSYKKTKIIKKNMEWLFKQKKNQSNEKNSHKEQESSKSEQNKSNQHSSSKDTLSQKDEQNSSSEKKIQEESANQKESKERENSGNDQNSSDEKNDLENAQDTLDQKNDLENTQNTLDQKKREENNTDSKNKNETSQKDLTKREEEAILEEVQKQENKVRSLFFRRKGSFGDKTDKDW